MPSLSPSIIYTGAAAVTGLAALYWISKKQPSILAKDGEPLASVDEIRSIVKQMAMVAAQLLQGLSQQQSHLLRMNQMDPEELKSAFLGEFVNQLKQVQQVTLQKFGGVEGGLQEQEFDQLLEYYKDDAELRKFAGMIRDCYRKLGGEFTEEGIFGNRHVSSSPSGQTDDGDETSGDIDDVDELEEKTSATSAQASASGSASGSQLSLEGCLDILDSANDKLLTVLRSIKKDAEEKGLSVNSPEVMQSLMMAQAQSQAFVQELCNERGTSLEVIQDMLGRPEHQMAVAQHLMVSQQRMQKILVEEGFVPAGAT